MAKFSNSLKFIDSGADFIQLVLDIYGVNEQIELIREERHPQTDIWTLTYPGYLDLSTWTREKNQVSVKFNSGGLEQLLKSRESEKIEIDRLTTIDGKTIPALIPIDVELEGRRIFLKSKLEIDEFNNSGRIEIFSDDGNVRGDVIAFPFKVVNKSHEEVTNSSIETHGNTSGAMFFLQSTTTRNFKLKIHDLQFSYQVTDRDRVDRSYIRVILVRFDQNNNVISQRNLYYRAEPQNG